MWIPGAPSRGVVALAALLVASAGAGTTAAQEGDRSGNPAWADALFDDTEEMAATYNENVDGAREEMSPKVYDRLTGKAANAYLVGADVTFSFRLTDASSTPRPRPRDDARLAMY